MVIALNEAIYPSQRKGSVLDTENVCPKAQEDEVAPEATLIQPASTCVEAQPVLDMPASVLNVNSVPEGDLEDLQLKDTHNRTTCARAREAAGLPSAIPAYG